MRAKLLAGFLFIVVFSLTARAQTTEFVYQGQLQNLGAPANGSFDFEFLLFDTLAGPNQIGPPLMRNGVAVSNGGFSVRLDFGASFPGPTRFIEIHVRQTGGGAFTPLMPRQLVGSAPYSIKTLNADTAATATNASQLGGVDSSLFVKHDAGGNVAITGGLTVTGTFATDTINAQTQFNLGGQRILGVGGQFGGSFFAGIGAGAVNSNVFGGSANTFVGFNAGALNDSGQLNSFFGSRAGEKNVDGQSNAFFGARAGSKNVSAAQNSFFGSDAGSNNTANFNSFFGSAAGFSNTTGFGNAFFGRSAGLVNVTGIYNSFFGYNSGRTNVANENSFFGAESGAANTTGDSNTFFGAFAGNLNVSASGNSFFGHYAGQNNVAANNSFFGSSAGLSNTTGNNNSFFGIEAGKASNGLFNSFFGAYAGTNNTSGLGNSFFGDNTGGGNTTGGRNTFFGGSAGYSNSIGSGNAFFGDRAGQNTNADNNAFFGTSAGSTNTTGTNNTLIGNLANVGANNLSNATAIGANAVVSQSNSVVLGNNANVGIGTSTPGSKLTVAGLIETTAVGVKFPDGTTQTTAAAGVGTSILNQTTLQVGANFNIDGTGKASVFDASTHYFLQGNRFISMGGENSNTMVGILAGESISDDVPSPSHNSFFGRQAGTATISGSNSFFGSISGRSNISGSGNAFFGFSAGVSNVSGAGNTFIGTFAGTLNTTGDENTVLGYNSYGANGITNSTSIGARAVVTQSNSIVLGSIGGQNGAAADTNVGIGTPAPKAKLDVAGGNILVGSPGQGIILKSPDGATCRLLSIDNAGDMALTAIACP